MASRLAETLSTRGNIAYSYQTFNTVYKNTSLFGVYAVSAPGEGAIDDVIYHIFDEFQRLGAYVSADQLQRAKNKVKSSLLMQLDGNMQVAEDIGRQLLTIGRRMSPAEIFA